MNSKPQVVWYFRAVNKSDGLDTYCAICGTPNNSEVVYAPTITPQEANTSIFSARRLPDRKHFQWVKCKKCSLYRSDPIFQLGLENLYKESSFDYSAELHGLNKTYVKLIKQVENHAHQGTFVEIGGGNGFILEEVEKLGYKMIIEIEPSLSALEYAKPHLKKYFRSEMLSADTLPKNSVDLAVMFHVLDHLPHPKQSLEDIYNFLTEGAHLVVAVHNVESLSSKLLGSSSPIFDVEHTYLYSKATLEKILLESGFSNVTVKRYANSYSLNYLIHLIPIPNRVKRILLSSRFFSMVTRIRFTLPLGNIYGVGSKINL